MIMSCFVLPVQEMVERMEIEGDALLAQHLHHISHFFETLICDQVQLCVACKKRKQFSFSRLLTLDKPKGHNVY